MTMATVSGKEVGLDLKLHAHATREGAATLPEEGFSVSHFYLTQVLADHSTTSAALGVSRKGPGGWVRIKDERDGGDLYLTTVAWLKKT